MRNLQQVFPSSAPICEKREVFTHTAHRDIATNIAILEEWRKAGELDRADGPALIWRDAASGIATCELWWKNGKQDRADGPAVIVRDAETGTVMCEEWWKRGKRIAAPSL